MRVPRFPANGVPWLYWLGDDTWACLGCGAAGPLAPSLSVPEFVRRTGDLKRAHARCGAAAASGDVGGTPNLGPAGR